MSLSRESVAEALKQVKDPELNRDIVALGMVKEIGVHGARVFVHLELTSQNPKLAEAIEAAVVGCLKKQDGVESVDVQFSAQTKSQAPLNQKQAIPGIKNIIAVSSGKGGVGKSTTAVNLAVALKEQGNRVGLMDGDIYGPNIPLMLGIDHNQKPQVSPSDKMIPIESKGIHVISMGVLVPPDQPMVWRGPMLHSAVTQFLQKVEWGELDYLVVDLPPGTGDVQLSLVQSAPLTGAVIVTTPQEVSLMDVRKAVLMFKKTHVPILGILENMTGEIFGQGGGREAAEQFSVPFLGDVPLDGNIRKGGDLGEPVVLAHPDSKATHAFKKAAEILVENLNEVASSS